MMSLFNNLIHFLKKQFFAKSFYLSSIILLFNSYNIEAQQRGTLTDYDNNIYQTILIGNQRWMAENLKTPCYANATSLVDATGVGSIIGNYTGNSGHSEHLIPKQTEHMIPKMVEHLKTQPKHHKINTKQLHNLFAN
ncbi:hypothetical protein ACFLSY_01940 [Bacteroidota bacterium]